MNVTVYALKSTRDGEIRYVGQTVQKTKTRLAQHKCDAVKRHITPVHKWIVREIDDGFVIDIFTLESGAQLHTSEISWIAKFRSQGARLLNLTDGGEGTIGWHGNKGNKRPDLAERNCEGKGKPGRASTPEINAKISAALKGRKAPWASERNRSMKGKPGHKHTPESRAKIAAANTNKIVSRETREKMSAIAFARPMTESRLAQLRRAREVRHAQ